MRSRISGGRPPVGEDDIVVLYRGSPALAPTLGPSQAFKSSSQNLFLSMMAKSTWIIYNEPHFFSTSLSWEQVNPCSLYLFLYVLLKRS